MKKILIVDASKASLVMTSEVFKDSYPGIQVVVARTSAKALEILEQKESFDACIVDFDLPDKNGSETALIIKENYNIPVLITAFDSPEVTKTIDTLLNKYEDCRTWLKKPVNSEVVMAVTRRFCEKNIQEEKRISCHLPALAKISIPETIMQATKTIKTKKMAENETDLITKKESKLVFLSFCGIIEDCSLNGVMLKPSKSYNEGLTNWSLLLENMEKIPSGSQIRLCLATSMDIEDGKTLEISKIPFHELIGSTDSTQKKKLVENKEISKIKEPNKKKALSNTLSNNENVQRKIENRTQSIDGKIVWTSTKSGEWCVGVEFNNTSLSKRLFEAVVQSQSKNQKIHSTQSIMKNIKNNH